jgi:hypothetical protein
MSIAGAAAATTTLKRFGYLVDFSAVFAKDGVDLMRPKGKRYLGLFKEVDRSLGEAAAPSDSQSVGTDEDPLSAKNILAFKAATVLLDEQSVLDSVALSSSESSLS